MSASNSASSFSILSVKRVAEGLLVRFSHDSVELKLPSICALFLPTAALDLDNAKTLGGNFPVLVYLSGLTCTDENVCQKGGAFHALKTHKLAFLCPDTSPRGANVPGEDDSWEFGTGAGFYIDATQPAYSENYRMYSYVTKELPALLSTHFPLLCDITRMGITGHSMGGHGALTCALKNAHLYRSVSALAPISNPSECAIGQKAFIGYLGSVEAGGEYDACKLLNKLEKPLFDEILIDVGTADNFVLDGTLLPRNLKSAADLAKQPLTLREQEGYDHSYYFVSTFLPEHVAFHALRLKQ